MRLYLIQHGDALPEEVQSERRLSPIGERQIEALGQLLFRAGIEVQHLLHSSKTRTRQTAELLARPLRAAERPRGIDGIDSDDPVEPLADLAARWEEDTAVCTHMPFVAGLASRLLAGRTDPTMLDFRPGTMACLERRDGAGWALLWMVPPSLLLVP